jgi:excisionase family DNA binding protein
LAVTAWMTVEQVAEYLQLSAAKVYELVRASDLPGYPIGKQWRFDQNEIDTWVRSKNPKRASRRELKGERG